MTKHNLTVELLPTEEQQRILKETIGTFNALCNYVSEVCLREKIFNQVKLHHRVYAEARQKFPELAAQFIVRAIARVASAYHLDKKAMHRFKKNSPASLDSRLLSFKSLDLASIHTTQRRQRIPFIIRGGYAPLGIHRMKGQADLTIEKGRFFLDVIVEIPEKSSAKREIQERGE